MTIAWIVGSSGLLGSALCRALRRIGTELFSPPERFHWSNESELAAQFATAVQAFAARACAAERWEIYWAAGMGTMSSSDMALRPETRALSELLRLVQLEDRLMARSGALAVASSAGAIYGGSCDYIISESTSPAPTTAYARAKLEQEDVVRSFAHANTHVSAVLARLSTLYGPGQSFGKQQGLIAHIARCVLRNQPVRIYVPFDTIRDYITSDDAAAAMVTALRAGTKNTRVLTKIIASEQPTTIAEIIGIFRRITRRAPRVTISASKLSGAYLRRIRFRSMAGLENAPLPRTSLLVGIAQLMAAERDALAQGRLAGTI